MEILWDEPKRLSNLDKHAMDFAALDQEFFLSARLFPTRLGRTRAIWWLGDRIITVIFRPLGREARVGHQYAPGQPQRKKPHMTRKPLKEFDPDLAATHGYTRADWDAVDSPDITDEEIASGGKSFDEMFPDLAASIRRKAGRPPVDAPKEAVTLRLAPATVERFKAKGPDWRSRMAQALDKAKL